MTNAENGALITPEKNMHEFTEEQRKVAQALLRIIGSLSPEKYDLKTHLGRYTFSWKMHKILNRWDMHIMIGISPICMQILIRLFPERAKRAQLNRLVVTILVEFIT